MVYVIIHRQYLFCDKHSAYIHLIQLFKKYLNNYIKIEWNIYIKDRVEYIYPKLHVSNEF